MPSSRGSSRPMDRTHVFCIGRRIVYRLVTWQVLASDETVAEVPRKAKARDSHHSLHAESSLSVNEPSLLPVILFF